MNYFWPYHSQFSATCATSATFATSLLPPAFPIYSSKSSFSSQKPAKLHFFQLFLPKNLQTPKCSSYLCSRVRGFVKLQTTHLDGISIKLQPRYISPQRQVFFEILIFIALFLQKTSSWPEVTKPIKASQSCTNLKKFALFSHFICICQKKVLTLHPQSCGHGSRSGVEEELREWFRERFRLAYDAQ